MSQTDVMKALREIESQQEWNKTESDESKLQQVLSNPKALFGLIGARMGLRSFATMNDGDVSKGLETVAMKGATGTPVAAAGAATPNIPDWQEPGMLHGIFNEVGDVFSKTMADNPYLGPAGLGLGTLGLLGAYGLKDRKQTQKSITDYKKRQVMAKGRVSLNPFENLAGGVKGTAGDLSKTATGLFMGTQALGLAGVGGMSAAAMPLLGAGMALRSPVGAAAMAGALGQNMGWWNLANASTAATAGLNPMMTGMASIPSLVGHAAAAPLNLMGGLGNEAFGKTMEGAAGGITGIGDAVANMFSGSPIAAMIGGGLSMALAGKGLNKGVGLVKDTFNGKSALLKSNKFTVPRLQGAAAEEKRYSRTGQLVAGVNSLIARQELTSYESYSLLFLSDLVSSNSLLRAMFDQNEATKEGKSADVNLAQNNVQSMFGHTGDERTDLKQAWYDRTKDYWAPEGSLSYKFDQMSTDLTKDITNIEGMVKKFSIIANPLHWVTGGKSSISELLKSMQLDESMGKAKQQYSQISGEAMEFVEAKNVSVTSLMNEADTYEGKVLNILGTLLPLAQERNFTLKDIAKVFGVTPDKSSAGDLERVMTNIEVGSLDLNRDELKSRHLWNTLSKAPILGPIANMVKATKDAKLKKQGKIKVIDDDMVASVVGSTLSDIYATPEVGSALPSRTSLDLTETNGWLGMIADYMAQLVECVGCGKLKSSSNSSSIAGRTFSSIEDTRQEILDEEENNSDDATQEGILASLRRGIGNQVPSMVPGARMAGRGLAVGLGGILTGNVSKVLSGLIGVITGASMMLIGPVISALGALGAFLLTPPGIMLAIAGVAMYVFWDEITESIDIIGDKFSELTDRFTDWWKSWELSDLAPWNWDWDKAHDNTMIALGLMEDPQTIKNRKRYEDAQRSIREKANIRDKEAKEQLGIVGSERRNELIDFAQHRVDLNSARDEIFTGGINSQFLTFDKETRAAVVNGLSLANKELTRDEGSLLPSEKKFLSQKKEELTELEKTKEILQKKSDSIAAMGGDPTKIDTDEERKAQEELHGLLGKLLSSTQIAAQYNTDGQGDIAGAIETLANAISQGNSHMLTELRSVNSNLKTRPAFIPNVKNIE